MTQHPSDAARVASAAGSVQQPVAAAVGPSTRAWNIGREVAAVAFLVGAALLPWNLFFGVGIPGSSARWFAVLLTVTVLALGSIVAAHAHRPAWRTILSAPYAVFVLAVVVFDLVETVKYGGDQGAPGVGPGVWLGAAGAVLASQPVLTGTPQHDIDQRRPWLRAARLVGATSTVLAALSVGFMLYWQTKDAVAGLGQSGLFGRSLAVIVTAVVYEAAALAPIVVVSGWMLQRNKGSRLATIGLGMSTLAAGLLVWFTHAGREIDVYHGIAQITSLTASVGFEGYLAWAVAAAIFAPLTLRAVLAHGPVDASAWHQASRQGLLLAAVGCIAAAIMRLTDVVVAVSFGVHGTILEGVVLVVLDVAAAALAWWLRGDHDARPRVASALPWAYLLLFGLTVSRVFGAITLTPRQPGLGAAAGAQPVYGNALTQQLTSTFDIVLCVLAAGIAVSAWLAARAAESESSGDVVDVIRGVSRADANDHGAATALLQAAVSTSAASDDDAGQSPAATTVSAPGSTKQAVDAVLQASTQRFGAGTTYTGRGASDGDG